MSVILLPFDLNDFTKRFDSAIVILPYSLLVPNKKAPKVIKAKGAENLLEVYKFVLITD
jgi:hypothetical protein